MKNYEVYYRYHGRKCKQKIFIDKGEALNYVAKLEENYHPVYMYEWED